MFKSISLALFFLLSASCLLAQDIGDSYYDNLTVIRNGIQLHDEQKYKEAIAEYNKIESGDSLYTFALYEKALSFYSDSQFVEVIPLCDEMAAIPSSYKAEMLLLKANALDGLKRTDEAMAAYEAYKLDYPQSYRPYFEMSVSHSVNKEFEKAIPMLLESARLNMFSVNTHKNFGIFAAEADQPALAIMACFFASILSSDNPDLSLAIISSLVEKIGANDYEKTMNVKPEIYAFAEELASLNEIVSSKAALNKTYKSKVKVDYNYTRQLQVICEKLPASMDSGNWLLDFYVSFYKKMWNDGHFQGMVYQPLASSSSPKLKKLAQKNMAKINAFVKAAGKEMETKTKSVSYKKMGKEVTGTFHYKDNHLFAIGDVDSEKEANGNWEFYSSNSVKIAEGEYSHGKKIGMWKYYTENGIIAKEENFVNGEKSGVEITYHGNGMRERELYLVDGKVEGKVKNHYYSGALQSEYEIKSDKLQGDYIIFDKLGARQRVIPLKDGKENGLVVGYYSNGNKSFETNYAEGKATGKATYWHDNGTVSSEGNFEKGERNGVWKWFHENGKIREEGSYDSGNQTGEWKEYTENGKLESVNFYKSGKLNGISKSYDRYGNLLLEVEYANGKGKRYAFFDEKGSKIHEAKTTSGKLKVETYNELRQREAEGEFYGDDREGEWKYYNLDGSLDHTVIYRKDMLNGEGEYYWPNGKLSKEVYYKDNELQGYYRRYDELGTLTEEGYYLDGERHGPVKTYYPDGKLEQKLFFWRGEQNGVEWNYQHGGEKDKRFVYDMGLLTKADIYNKKNEVVNSCDIECGTGPYMLTHADKSKAYTVNFKYGEAVDEAISYNTSGSIMSKVPMKYGNRHGKATYYHDNGKVSSEGEYKNGLQEGLWKYYDEDGKLTRETNFYEGDRHGKYTNYHSNGKVDTERYYYFDERDSIFRSFAPDGQLMVQIEYYRGVALKYTYTGKDGKLVNPIEIKNNSGKILAYYQNGNKSYELNYVYGMWNGAFEQYYPDGKLLYKAIYVNDKIEGKMEEYYANGNKESEGEYKYNEETGVMKHYHENGKLKRETTYDMGVKHGTEKVYDKNGKLISEGIYYYGEYAKK
jgi:uncharacterized protein